MTNGRPRRKLVDNFKIDLREIGRIGMNWIGLAQDRALVNEVMNIQVPQNAGKFLSGYTTCGLSSSAELQIVRKSISAIPSYTPRTKIGNVVLCTLTVQPV
jgi:hypothetical protein